MEEFIKANAPAGAFEMEYTNRNKIALTKFDEQVSKSNPNAKSHIAIYYGAGHMPYFEKQLSEKYGLEITAEEWITAFSY